MNSPPKLRFRLQMPFLYHPAGYVPVHFENNRVQLLQWLLPLYSIQIGIFLIIQSQKNQDTLW